MPAAKLEIVYRALADIRPYPNNARTHTPQQIVKLKKSLAKYGWTNSMLIADGQLLAGHARLDAAIEMAAEGIPIRGNADPYQGPTVDLSHLSKAERRAYIIADNQLSITGTGWDDDILRAELSALTEDGFDLGLTGFDDTELASLLADQSEGLTDPDEVPEVPQRPVSVRGDVWCMGRHRLMCGDATSAQNVSALTQGALVDLCFTSPPYLNQRDYETGVADWDALMNGVFTALPVKEEAQLLVNLGMVHRNGEWLPYWDGWVSWMRERGWKRFGWYVWDQGFGLPGDWNGRLAPSHEWVFHFNRVTRKANKTVDKQPDSVGRIRKTNILRRGDKKHAIDSPERTAQPTKIPDSVIRVLRQQGSIGKDLGDHPAVFPVDLVSEMLTAFSDPDDVVYEPFCGSGTQIISAQKNGRTCLAMEISPSYCDVAIQRWQNFSGQRAVLEGTGILYEEVAAEREAQQLSPTGLVAV